MQIEKNPRVYCTYFDSGYLSRGLALIASLREHGDNAPVYVLALDETAAKYLDEFAPENVFVVRIEQLEETEPSLLPLKSKRSRMEYYFTCTPLLIRYIMNLQSIPGAISIYLDGDLFFFDAPDLVIEALGDSSVGIIEHRYTDSRAKKLAKYGRFNVGWVGFRDDEKGRTVLDWYSEQTLNWCSDKPEDGKYADQGYLNWFPDFSGVKVLDSPGFNLAPWNVQRHKISVKETLDGNFHPIADNHPLVFFHFHGLRRVGKRFATGELSYGAHLSTVLKQRIYIPYVNNLMYQENLVSVRIPTGNNIQKRGNGVSGYVSRLRKTVLNLIAILSGNSVKAR